MVAIIFCQTGRNAVVQRDFTKKPLRIFLTYYRPHWKLLALDMLCVLFSSFANLLFPIASRSAMNRLLPAQKFGAFFAVMALLFLAYLIKAMLSYCMTVIGHRCGMYMEADMREDLFSHLQDMSFSFFDRNRTGELMSRMTSDLFSITEMAHHGPENIVMASITLIGSVIILFSIQWQIALVLMILVPLCVFITITQRQRMKRTNIAVKKRQAEINSVIESGISGARTAKAFANEDQENAKFRVSNENYKGSKRDWYRAMGTFMSSMEFTMSALQVIVIASAAFSSCAARWTISISSRFRSISRASCSPSAPSSCSWRRSPTAWRASAASSSSCARRPPCRTRPTRRNCAP